MMRAHAQRQFAFEVVQKLRAHSFEALWAGGCVRDQLLGRKAKDYDVATNARPEEIQEVFGRGKTLQIGAAFGVIMVLGTEQTGNVEVATFRKDESYSDGRRPDSVVFTTADQDAQRRDFTINGLFYDPVDDRVIDFVGGRADLEGKLVRAIGDAAQRFAEDKLRLLRAVRFAATFDFALEQTTLQAIQQMADQIAIVSAERIAEEMRKMLVDAPRARAVELLVETGLLEVILPEIATMTPMLSSDSAGQDSHDTPWQRTLGALKYLKQPSFPLALAVLVHTLQERKVVQDISVRWRLSNQETARVQWLVEHQGTISKSKQLPWPRLQRILISDGSKELIELDEAIAAAQEADLAGVAQCRRLLAQPREELDPPLLLSGDDLKSYGVVPGKVYKMLLEKVRDAQLENQIQTKSEALTLVKKLLDSDLFK